MKHTTERMLTAVFFVTSLHGLKNDTLSINFISNLAEGCLKLKIANVTLCKICSYYA